MGEINDPIPLDEALKKYGDKLSEYEKEEIKQFDELFYVGQRCRKKIKAPCEGMNHGYDNEEGEYHIVPHDHIAYRYEIEEELGKGAFGQVVRAIDHADNTVVAIKLIRNRRKIALQARQEIKILRVIREEDPGNRYGLVAMFESFSFRGHVCIVYELLGASLYDQMKAHDFYPMKINVVRQIAARMLVSLTFLWKKNIVHCDLKPENVLMRDSTTTLVKIVDLGSATFDEKNPFMYIQSRFYRAPEVILGAPYGKPIDLWSFACILCELATGWPIFAGEDERDQLFAIMEYLGQPPAELISVSRCKNRYFDAELNPLITENKRGKIRKVQSKTLSSFLALPEDDLFIDFLGQFLKWNAADRVSPREAMDHPWVRDEFVFDKPQTNEEDNKTGEEESTDTGAFSSAPNPTAERNRERRARMERPAAPLPDNAPGSPTNKDLKPSTQAETSRTQPATPNMESKQEQTTKSKSVARSVPNLQTTNARNAENKRRDSKDKGAPTGANAFKGGLFPKPIQSNTATKSAAGTNTQANTTTSQRALPNTANTDARSSTTSVPSAYTNCNGARAQADNGRNGNNNRPQEASNGGTTRSSETEKTAPATDNAKVTQTRDRSLSLHPLTQNKNGNASPKFLPAFKPVSDLLQDASINYSPSPTREDAKENKNTSNENSCKSPRRVSRNILDKVNMFEQLSASTNPEPPRERRRSSESENGKPAPAEVAKREPSKDVNEFRGQYSVLLTNDDAEGATSNEGDAITPTPPARRGSVPGVRGQRRVNLDELNVAKLNQNSKSSASADEKEISPTGRRKNRNVGQRAKQNSVSVVPENTRGTLPQI